MKHHIFISYPVAKQDLVENFAGRLRELGVEAWVYSLDKTLAEGIWEEIEAKIAQADLFLFVASQQSVDAKGQHRELELALTRIQERVGLRAMPIVVDDTKFEDLPLALHHTNGLRLDTHTVYSTAVKVVKTIFPELLTAARLQEWRYPRPGQWLEITDVDEWTEGYFELGDRVYFRRISPLGLFECYSSKLGDLFWLAPQNLGMAELDDEHRDREDREVPWQYRCASIYECERVVGQCEPT